MSIVAGVDFGTLSVRVSIFDSGKGRLGSGVGSYPLHRKHDDPDHATQSSADQWKALIEATRAAIASAGIKGEQIEALAVDTTGSSVIPLGENLEPLDGFYLWCDHRAWREAAQITETARQAGLPALQWCGGAYSSEWGFSKLLHWLRHNPEKRHRLVTAMEHCDYVAAVLCGITNLDAVPRSVCAMGHKWMWNPTLGGLPSEEFFTRVDPLLAGVRAKVARGKYATSDTPAGTLSEHWAQQLGLRPGIPIPVGALDAHWDAIGAAIKLGDVVNVIGTSTCVIGLSESFDLIKGVCGVVQGSVHPAYTGIEAGLSASGDVFDAIAARARTTVAELSRQIAEYRPGQTGLLRIPWDNGDRTVLVNPELGCVSLGSTLTHTPEDELFAAIEGTAFHTRIILEHMQRHGTTVRRVINGGGIPQKNELLNQVYANVLNKPILVPNGDITGLGAAIFAFQLIGTFKSVEEAQDKLCPSFREFEPQEANRPTYDALFELFRRMYFAFGTPDSSPAAVGDVLPALRRIAAQSRAASG